MCNTFEGARSPSLKSKGGGATTISRGADEQGNEGGAGGKAGLIVDLDPMTHHLRLLQNGQLRRDLELSQNGQTMLIDKLIACCKEVRMIPVNHTYPSLGHFNVFSYVSPFVFWVGFTSQIISRMRSGHNGCSRRYEKNWRREGQSLQLVGTERCNAIPPTASISNRVWMNP